MGERMFQAKRKVSLLLPSGVANRVVGTNDGANMIMKQIADADVASGADIGLSKLLHVGSGNVLRSNGTTNAAGKVQTADIADGAITSTQILDRTITGIDIAARTISGTDQVALDSISALEIIARAITTGSTTQQAPTGTLAAGSAWSWSSVSNSISGLVPGRSYVLAILTLAHSYALASTAGGIGIGVDSLTSPAGAINCQTPTVAGHVITPTMSLLVPATATTHNFYGLVYTAISGVTMPGWPSVFTLIAFHA